MKSGIVRLLKLAAQLIGISTSPSQKQTGEREKRFELFRQRDVAMQSPRTTKRNEHDGGGRQDRVG